MPFPKVGLLLREYSLPRERVYRAATQKHSLYSLLAYCIATAVHAIILQGTTALGLRGAVTLELTQFPLPSKDSIMTF